MAMHKFYLQYDSLLLNHMEQRFDFLPATVSAVPQISLNRLCYRQVCRIADKRSNLQDSYFDQKMLRHYRDYAVQLISY